jgi:hypothetical protein
VGFYPVARPNREVPTSVGHNVRAHRRTVLDSPPRALAETALCPPLRRWMGSSRDDRLRVEPYGSRDGKLLGAFRVHFQPLARMNGAPRCRRCTDVIGVYQPVIWLVDGGGRETSRAAEPDVGTHGDLFHRCCYAQLVDPDSAHEPVV